MTNATTIKNKLGELTDFITEATTRLEDGEVINLSHLDDEVDTICNAAMSLPPAEAAKVQEPMSMMISKLEQLGLALKDFQSHLKTEYDIKD